MFMINVITFETVMDKCQRAEHTPSVNFNFEESNLVTLHWPRKAIETKNSQSTMLVDLMHYRCLSNTATQTIKNPFMKETTFMKETVHPKNWSHLLLHILWEIEKSLFLSIRVTVFRKRTSWRKLSTITKYQEKSTLNSSLKISKTISSSNSERVLLKLTKIVISENC